MRLILAGTILFALVFGWFAVRWQLGNMIVNLTQPADKNAAEIADLALSWAPADPAANWFKASRGDAVQMYEQIVRLAPYDYRWRIELARAYEQDDNPASAEIEFKKAIELAPSYAYPRWHLGNFYLRQDRNDEAMAELKRAGENDHTYRDQVFSLAWDFFNKDASQLENLAGDKPDARVHLAYFFAARGRAADSLRNWNLLSDEDKAANPQFLKVIAQGVYEQRYFPQALEFARQLGMDQDAQPETVTNASFEKGLGESPDSRFGWRITRNDPKFEVATDSKVKREGNRSIRVSFRNFIKPELYNIFQTVVVEPNRKYRLHFWVRTENLKTAGAPLLELINANDDKLIARSPGFPTGTNDWQEMTIEFGTPGNCSGIIIRTARSFCGEECPITGTFWYDDFELGSQ